MILTSPTKTYYTGGYKKQYVMEGHGRNTYVSADNGGATVMQ